MTHQTVVQVTVVAMNDAPTHDSQLPATAILPGQRMDNTTDWRPALSASRAKEYAKCPLQYRLHVVDGIKEPPTHATVRGTLIHSVLENLFDVPAAQRTPEYAVSVMDPLWDSMRSTTAGINELFSTAQELSTWLTETRDMINNYFSVEDPRFLEPAAREAHIVVETPEGIRLRGFIDRVDRAPNGAIRIVDYKTGKAPSPRFQEEALYQMRFYALLLQLTEVLPARTQLLYIKSGQVLTLDPTPEDIDRFRLELASLWERIESDAQRGYFTPRKNPLCNWCGVQQFCPLFGGETPPLPEAGITKLLEVRAV